jgi:hypothetical protein
LRGKVNLRCYMELEQALSQISEIHHHLVRTECYRGYRSATMAMTAGVAILGGAVQQRIVSGDCGFVTFWVALAILNLVLVLSGIGWEYWMRLSHFEQRLTCRTVAQFVPSLIGGVFLTLAFQHTALELLPGLWAILFSLGVFASRPYLPQGIGWVGLFYLVCGCLLLTLANAGHEVLSWSMPATFGFGQLLLSRVLYWNLERAGQPR